MCSFLSARRYLGGCEPLRPRCAGGGAAARALETRRGEALRDTRRSPRAAAPPVIRTATRRLRRCWRPHQQLAARYGAQLNARFFSGSPRWARGGRRRQYPAPRRPPFKRPAPDLGIGLIRWVASTRGVYTRCIQWVAGRRAVGSEA